MPFPWSRIQQWSRIRYRLISPKAALAQTSSYTRRVFLTFLLLYLFLIFFARYNCYRDPTSAFFQPSKAYAPEYSLQRTAQADRYINEANATSNEGESLSWKSSEHPTICVGIASIARKNTRYFKSTVGSVLEGLSEAERADMHLILFIAHTDPSEHPAYDEPWFYKVADQVLLYNNETVDIDYIHDLETSEARLFAREKALFDYTYLLKSCAAVNASYVAMLEDDVMAMDGWYYRTRQALDSVERQMAEKGESKCE